MRAYASSCRASCPATFPVTSQIVSLIGGIKRTKDLGIDSTKLVPARSFQRKAKFYLDFVEAENSTGFHAPDEALRILGESVNFTSLGQVSVHDLIAGPITKR
jgi:nitrite reductase (cytochrome c-552)